MTTELCYTYYIQLVERLVEFPSDCRTKVHFCSKKKFSSQAPEPYLIRTFPVNLCFFSSYLYHRFSNQQPTKLSMYVLPFLCMRFYTGRKYFINKNCLFYAKCFEFEEKCQASFFCSSIQPQHTVVYALDWSRILTQDDDKI